MAKRFQDSSGLRAGRLRSMVSIVRKTDEQNPTTGTIKEVWVPLYSGVYAGIEGITARERDAAATIDEVVDTRIVVRYKPLIDTKCRVVHGTRLFDVVGALRDTDSGVEYLTLRCVEVVL